MSTLDIDQARVGRRHHRRARRPYAARFPRPPQGHGGASASTHFFCELARNSVFFVSWIAAIGLTELPFFVSWNATPIFRELAEEKGRTKYLSTPSRNFSHT